MKILVSITAALLVAVSGTSGYFVWHLNEQITESTQQWETSVQELIQNLNTTVDADDKSFLEDIENVDRSLNTYSLSLQEEISGTEKQIADLAQRAGDFKKKTTATEEFIGIHLADTQLIYEKAREATVRISWKGYYLGSGFVVNFLTQYGSSEEYVVTSFGVAEIVTLVVKRTFWEKEDIILDIALYDGRIYSGVLFVSSEESDIALIKFRHLKQKNSNRFEDYGPVSSLILADSSDISVGDPVFVIGSPDDGETYRLGLKGSLTCGIISQTDRISNLVQFDTAVNVGESGSPLLNKNGEVIGMFLYRVHPMFGEGIGLAVPSNQIKIVGDLLRKEYDKWYYGKAAYTYDSPEIQITVSDLLPKDIVANSNTIHSGVKVIQVFTSADVRTDDIITGIDDYPVQTSDDFSSLIVEHYAAGDEITLKIIRDGSEITSTLILD